MRRALSRVLAVGLALAAASGPVALAQQPPTPAPVMPASVPAKVSVIVRVIDASSERAYVDPKLAGWASALAKTPFSSFTLLQERTLLLPDGDGGTLSLPDGRTLALQLTSHNSTEATVAVSSRRAGAEPVETTLTITRNRAFMYVLRLSQPGQAGHALLLKVDVRY